MDVTHQLGQVDRTDDKWTLKIEDSDFTSISITNQQVEIERRSPSPYTYNFIKENYVIPEDFDQVSTTIQPSGGALVVARSNSLHAGISDYNLMLEEETLNDLLPLSIMLIIYTCMLYYECGRIFHIVMTVRAAFSWFFHIPDLNVGVSSEQKRKNLLFHATGLLFHLFVMYLDLEYYLFLVLVPYALCGFIICFAYIAECVL